VRERTRSRNLRFQLCVTGQGGYYQDELVTLPSTFDVPFDLTLADDMVFSGSSRYYAELEDITSVDLTTLGHSTAKR
jgi:hypothetical protein